MKARSGELKLTAMDRRWLGALGARGDDPMPEPEPVPMVSVDQYMMAVSGAERALVAEREQRKRKRGLWRRYCQLRVSREKWRAAAVLLAVMWAMKLVQLGGERWMRLGL